MNLKYSELYVKLLHFDKVGTAVDWIRCYISSQRWCSQFTRRFICKYRNSFTSFINKQWPWWTSEGSEFLFPSRIICHEINCPRWEWLNKRMQHNLELKVMSKKLWIPSDFVHMLFFEKFIPGQRASFYLSSPTFPA